MDVFSLSAVQKSIVCCVLLGYYASASTIGNLRDSGNSSGVMPGEDPELRINDFKAGAGFLIIATFFLMGDYGLGFNEFQGSRTGSFETELATLKDRMSILGKISYQQGKSFKAPSDEDTWVDNLPLCKIDTENVHLYNVTLPPTALYRQQILDSIKRALNFVEHHIDQLHTIEPAFALSALKVVDDKHGGELQKIYPISDWISQICATFSDSREADSCKALTNLWKSRPGNWKSYSIIPTYGAEFKLIGSEAEVIWGRLNGECQLALLTRCEVPYVCERTLYDTTPRSQYMLTHQLLQRILSELGMCSTAKELVDAEVNHRLCAKMYKEAQLISAMGVPEILRDLFAEQIGMCGYMGYPNFLRQDWLDLILSWQSKSEYGCFVREVKGRNKFITTDKAIKRLKTKREEEEEVEVDEYCLPHFTSVALTALSAFWDYLEEKCGTAWFD